MTSIKIHIDPALPVFDEISYILKRFALNKKTEITFTESGSLISDSEKADLRVSRKFINNFSASKFGHQENLNKGCFIDHEDGSPDYLSTAFYMLGCLQEYDGTARLDSLGRFNFSESYQAKYKNAGQNIVQLCFDKLAEKSKVPHQQTPTRFFLSHDIDTVYESILQDGFYALKRGRIDIILKLLANIAMGRPDWVNIDQIMKLESASDAKSTFFWIVNKGNAERLKNADYDFKSSKIQSLVKRVTENGFENGIHKSISADSFESELSQFNTRPDANRYHYLKFNLPDGFDSVETAGLKLDASLGFAENIGFRNNYGQPYNPYNLKQRKAYSFVEVPLHVMDTTLFKYNRSDIKEAKGEIFKFFEVNRTNGVISVLWHNNFFSNYKYNGYLNLYKEILEYIRNNNFRTITQREIIEQFSIQPSPK